MVLACPLLYFIASGLKRSSRHTSKRRTNHVSPKEISHQPADGGQESHPRHPDSERFGFAGYPSCRASGHPSGSTPSRTSCGASSSSACGTSGSSACGTPGSSACGTPGSAACGTPGSSACGSPGSTSGSSPRLSSPCRQQIAARARRACFDRPFFFCRSGLHFMDQSSPASHPAVWLWALSAEARKSGGQSIEYQSSTD